MKGAQDRGEDAVLPRPSPRPLRLPLPLRPRRGRGGRGPKGKRGTGQGHPNAAMGTAPRGDDARTFTPKLGTPPPRAPSEPPWTVRPDAARGRPPRWSQPESNGHNLRAKQALYH